MDTEGGLSVLEPVLDPLQLELGEVLPPIEREAVQAAKVFRHTGVFSSRSEALVAGIFFGLRRGKSRRWIASNLGVSRNSISAIESLLEQSGQLEPLKDRLNRAVMQAGSEAADWIQELQESRDISKETAGILRSLWVGVGIASDKAAATGAAIAPQQAGASTTEMVIEYMRMRSSESQSGGNAAKRADFSNSTAQDAAPDATTAPVIVDLGRDGAEVAGRNADVGEGGRGGSQGRRVASNTFINQGEIFGQVAQGSNQ